MIGDKQGSKLVDELKATLEKEKKDRAKVRACRCSTTPGARANTAGLQSIALRPVHDVCIVVRAMKVVKQKQEKIDFLNAELNATRDSVCQRNKAQENISLVLQEAVQLKHRESLLTRWAKSTTWPMLLFARPKRRLLAHRRWRWHKSHLQSRYLPANCTVSFLMLTLEPDSIL